MWPHWLQNNCPYVHCPFFRPEEFVVCESPRLLSELESGVDEEERSDELVEEGNESLGICRQVEKSS